MTAAELEDAILRGDRDRCISLLVGAPEPQRRAAAPVALRWYRAGHDLRMGDVTEDAAVLAKSDPGPDEIRETAGIATLGTTSLSELKELKWRAMFFNEQAWDALAERRPAWLLDWTKWMVSQNPRCWSQIRPLVRRGLIPTPVEDAYIAGMIGQVWPKCPLELLRNDLQLLEHDVWRLFEVEGGGEDSLAARDKYAREDNQSWGHALKTLSEEGLLDRMRLLDASLDALERDFAQFRAGWFSAFHESLSPTLEERAARQNRYLALLGSRISPTVSFALKALSVLDKSDHLTGEALVGHVAPALAAREKSTVTLALKLLDRAVKRDSALSAPVAAVACEALLHEKPEVQGAALDLIERHGRSNDADLSALVRSRLDDLAPSQRPRAQAWLGTADPALPAPATNASHLNAALLARAEAIPERWRSLAGVDEALSLLQAEVTNLSPVVLEFGQFPVLAPAACIAPVETLEELIDVCAAVLENLGPPEEIERMLDGISRLCAERSEDFDRRVGPITKRAGSLRKRFDSCGAFIGLIERDLPELVLAWTRGSVAERGQGRVDLTWFPGHRILEVAHRAAERNPAPLLSAPTHQGSWIDPRILVRRLLELQSLNVQPLPYDTIQALLRLAPDHRAEALASAGGLQGEVGEAVRYALGGKEIAIGQAAALWVAAARSRTPGGDDADLEARHPQLGPDAALAARTLLYTQRKVYQSGGKEYAYFRTAMEIEPPPPSAFQDDLPTVMFHTRLVTETNGIPSRRWLATLWPAGREAWFEEGVRLLSLNLDWAEAEWQNRVHLEALLEPDTALGAMGLTLLVLGLAAKEAGESGLATDAAIAAFRDGRLTGHTLGSVMASVLTLGIEYQSPLPQKPGGLITATRWAKTLAEVARASALHADAVHTALQHALAGQPLLRPADLAALLELLHELSVQSGKQINHPEARAYLEAQQGGGKGGKLAKVLLALPPSAPSAHCLEVARMILEGRLERAERWSAMAEATP